MLRVCVLFVICVTCLHLPCRAKGIHTVLYVLVGHVYRQCIAIVEADLVVLELQDQDSIIMLDVIDI